MLQKKTKFALKKLISNLTGYNQKTIIEIPLQARFGNFLYFFLHCYIERQKGNNLYILYTKTMEQWLLYFPKLNDFVLMAKDYSKLDKLNWFSSFYQVFNEDFKQQDLNNFIRDCLLNGEIKSQIIIQNKTVINIRRGDFYKENSNTPSSFDQVSYIKKVKNYKPELFNLPIEIVSDVIEWCITNFQFLNNVSFKDRSSPMQDFISICTAKNLIISNSTFSYWGGYDCKYLSKENIVIAPNFGSTLYHNHIAVQLHPEWAIVDVINK